MPRRYKKNKKKYRNQAQADQHAREGEELSEALAGTDTDVKQFFWKLMENPSSREEILNRYEDLIALEKGYTYATKAKNYAEETWPKWKSGRTRMSGLVASRLFELIPQFMPIETKHSMIERLWNKYCPQSDSTIAIGPDANELEVQNSFEKLVDDKIRNYTLPYELESRFRWLAAGDSHVYQKLLNYFFTREKELFKQGMTMRFPTLFREIRKEKTLTKSITQSIEVGKHKIRLIFSPTTQGYVVKDYQPKSLSPSINNTTRYKTTYISQERTQHVKPQHQPVRNSEDTASTGGCLGLVSAVVFVVMIAFSF